MNTFKEKLRKEIVDPARKDGRVETFKAKALTGIQTDNTCEIEFKDSNGKIRKERGKIERVYGNNPAGGWFPKKGDSLIVESKGKEFLIVAFAADNYHEQIKKYQLKGDLHSNTITGSAPGYLY